MAENMFNSAHKATNDLFRKGYDQTKWEKYPVKRRKKLDKLKKIKETG